MKISVQWLNSYIDQPTDSHEIEQLLTDHGLPIESQVPLDDPPGDVMLDVEVTSNRSDCLSHVGLAREVAAGKGCGLTMPDCDLVNELEPGTDHTGEPCVDVTNDERELCPVYTARIIRGVKVAASPPWLVQRLEAVGLRSVNNVVDVTNFVLLELGQPLHAFDLGKISGPRIAVRRAGERQAIVAIDGSKHTLSRDTLVIADAQGPVAIAGVMGGLGSGVTEATTDILLESAVFDPMAVRRASRALKLTSDSSYRFERGVDPQGVDIASRRAAKLICQLAGGVVAPGAVRVGAEPAPLRTVTMRPARCNRILGLSLTNQQMCQPLDRLGFEPRIEPSDQRITCTVPSYRLDIHREVDLIEEVARLHGFDAIPIQPKIHIVAKPVQPTVAAGQKLGRVLVAYGYHEAITFSFLQPKFGLAFVPEGQQPVSVRDTQGGTASPMLRPSVLPSLLACRKSNQDVGNTGVRLFECGTTWTRQAGKIIERRRVAILSDTDDVQHGLREVRGAISELVEQLTGRVELDFVAGDLANMAAAARIDLDGRRLGYMGLIALSCQQRFELQSAVIGAELDLDTLLEAYPPERTPKPLPRFPAIGRELSVIVDEKVRWGQLQEQILTAKPALLEDLYFMGVYRGKPIPTGKKSVSFRLLFRDPDVTLRHEQVDPQVAIVVQRLENQLGAALRR